MGKSEIGDYLRKHHEFKHLDFEHETTLRRYLGGDEVGLRQRVAELKKGGRDVVITWGFVPDMQLRFILRLRSLGVMWVWFDGDRTAARREYLKAGRRQDLWEPQLANFGPTHRFIKS